MGISNIEKVANKDRIAIVAVGYNRLKAMARLLDSINNAHYDMDDVPLVISIDASGDTSLYDYAGAFEWKHGPKYVNIQEERLGLKKHIFQCFSLSKFFKGVIVLEDDLFVSPYFYHYADATLNKYGNETKVAGIALYRNEYNGFCNIPLQYVNNGNDVLAIQSCCSWGELINNRMWQGLSSWMEEFNEDFSEYDMDERIKGWNRAWSKYMYAYMLDTKSYFIYPNEPLTTNFNDAGGEHGGGSGIVQVSLMQGKRNYNLGDFDDLVKYDIYTQNEAIPQWLQIPADQVTVDYYGCRCIYCGRYILAPFKLPFKRIRGYGLTMRPWELNVKYEIEGDDLILYDRGTSIPVKPPLRVYSHRFLMYYFNRYMQHIRGKNMIVPYLWSLVKHKFKM